jgi:hypothetical protein
MKIRCKFKDPDSMHDAVVDAFSELPQPNGISQSEWRLIRAERITEAAGEISERWMEYGEYLDVEFDTEAHTATILPRGSID